MKQDINWQERYHAALIVTLRLRIVDRPGNLARVLSDIAGQGAPIGDIRMIDAGSAHKTRDLQVFFMDSAHLERTLEVLRGSEVAEICSVTDEVLEIHRGGAIETRSRHALDSIMDLRMIYTPGVASVCEKIAREPECAWEFTGVGNRIAIVTNGTAVLGLGDIGPLASLPVMEGKAAILAHFVGVWAEPFLIDSRDPDEIIETVARCAKSFGAIQLEDIAAPVCFLVERGLQDRLDVPVFHDDQHGTATVCIAGLISALRKLDRSPGECRAVLSGAGAAGSAIARFLIDFGIEDVVVCDSTGALTPNRESGLNRWKKELAEVTNPNGVTGSLADVMKGRNLFIGVSRPDLVTKEMVRSMSDDPIVFALANPVSEIRVDDALEAGAAIALDGRGMNNALAYPGLFRGALDVHARSINREMMLAAAHRLAELAPVGELLPDMLDLEVHQKVATAVRQAAVETGVARKVTG
ncbi:MAG: malic enzyme-like NAD(P)-binding protein [Planctomycetota bacterium]